MLPFSFALPFKIQINPKDIFTSATSSSNRRGSATDRSTILPLGYTQRPSTSTENMKLSWKSRLRRPHPFLSREPGITLTPRTELQKSIGKTEKNTEGISNPSLVKHVLLFTIFALSFAVLILGLVYADKVTSSTVGGTDVQSLLPVSTNTTSMEDDRSQTAATGHLLVRDSRTDIELDSRGDETSTVSTSNLSPFTSSTSSVQDPTRSNASSVVLDQDENQSGMIAHTPAALAALFFYIATMPIFSITHASIELALLVCLAAATRRPTRRASISSISDDDFDSDAETIIGEDEKWKHIGPPTEDSLDRQHVKMNKLRPHIPLLSTITSVMIMAGWIAVSTIQTHCELSVGGFRANVCPIQSDPTSHTVFNISIARSSFSWLVVVIYLGLITTTLKTSSLFVQAPPASISISSVNRVVSPPFTGKPILKTRSRSTSLRRKHVRFSLETESQHQQSQGDDGVHYIPAPSDGEDRHSEELRTPWQWQGGFVDDIEQDTKTEERKVTVVVGAYGRNASISSEATALNSNPTRSARKHKLPVSIYNTRANISASTRTVSPKNADIKLVQSSSSPPYQSRGGSFDLGLASMVRPTSNLAAMIKEQNSFRKKRSRSNSGLGNRPRLGRQDTEISAMSDGRRSVDVNSISRLDDGRRGVSPL